MRGMIGLVVGILLSGTAFAGTSVTEDFDGDGKTETIAQKEDQISLPGLTDGEIYCEVGSCTVSALDLDSAKKGKELSICLAGPRDDVSCSLYRLSAGKWSEVVFPKGLAGASELSAKGTGVLMASYTDRWYSRIERLTEGPSGLVRTMQPFYSTASEKRPEGFTYKPDRIFPIVDKVGGTEIVARVAPGNVVFVMLEDAKSLNTTFEDYSDEKRWFLVRTSSGLVGWASLTTILGSSDGLTMMNSAG